MNSRDFWNKFNFLKRQRHCQSALKMIMTRNIYLCAIQNTSKVILIGLHFFSRVSKEKRNSMKTYFFLSIIILKFNNGTYWLLFIYEVLGLGWLAFGIPLIFSKSCQFLRKGAKIYHWSCFYFFQCWAFIILSNEKIFNNVDIPTLHEHVKGVRIARKERKI